MANYNYFALVMVGYGKIWLAMASYC